MTSVPQGIRQLIETALRVRVVRARMVGGGCIAHAMRVDTTAGPFFVKWMDSGEGDTLTAEAAGLEALRDADSPLLIPEIMHEGTTSTGHTVLVMEWVEQGAADDAFWARFGRDLAVLHRHSGPQYGFYRPNYIGRLPQQNEWRDEWPAFFLTQRLQPQVERAQSTDRWRSEWDPSFARLQTELEQILPAHPSASILHGDLWSGNFLPAVDGRAALIDPATYHGDRETDLAMTELFGGFSSPFYAAYRSEWPLEAGYEERRDVYNLYHLLNHLNHFGTSYASGVARVLARFT